MNNLTKNTYCSFCLKSKQHLSLLFSVKNQESVSICNSCVELCAANIRKHYILTSSLNKEILTPKELFCKLSKSVIGQDDAVKQISTALFNHAFKSKLNLSLPKYEKLEKSNLMLIGPTGTGKTFTIEQAARHLKIPVSISDATKLTEAGYVGDDVETIILKLIQDADFDIKKAEQGIIYIDEIDKLAKKSSHSSNVKDISGEGVQQGLLKILEGTFIQVSENKKTGVGIGGRTFNIDTSGILFIGGGVFDGIDNIIEKRTTKYLLGLGSHNATVEQENDQFKNHALPKDLQSFGLIPEFVGRFPMTVRLKSLSEDNLRVIVKESNALRYFKIATEEYGIRLNITDDGINAIAHKAYIMNIGARGIRSVIERVFSDIMFQICSLKDKDIILNSELVESTFI